MKKSIAIFYYVLFLTAILSSCDFGPTIRGNGKIVEQERSLSNFDGVQVSNGLEVYISQGDTEKVLVVADENLHDVIETEVYGNVLHVKSSQRIKSAASKKVFVTFKQLNYIQGSSGSSVNTEDRIKVGELTVKGSSGAFLSLDIDADDLYIEGSSGAILKMYGHCNSGNVVVSSGSNLKAGALAMKKAHAEASSGANAFIKVEDELWAAASSGGNILYSGEPSDVTTESSSGGNINHRD